MALTREELGELVRERLPSRAAHLIDRRDCQEIAEAVATAVREEETRRNLQREGLIEQFRAERDRAITEAIREER